MSRLRAGAISVVGGSHVVAAAQDLTFRNLSRFQLAASPYDEKNHKDDDQDPPPLEMHLCRPDCLSENDSRLVDTNKPLSSWIVNVRCER